MEWEICKYEQVVGERNRYEAMSGQSAERVDSREVAMLPLSRTVPYTNIVYVQWHVTWPMLSWSFKRDPIPKLTVFSEQE